MTLHKPLDYYNINKTFSENMGYIGAKPRHRDVAAIVLTHHMNGMRCQARNKQISELASINQRTVSDTINELQKNGLIEVSYEKVNVNFGEIGWVDQKVQIRTIVPTRLLIDMFQKDMVPDLTKNWFIIKRTK